jgi:hypothetical protein
MAESRKRIVPAAVLRRCCRELKDQIDPRGLRLTNAVVTGELDLTGLVVPFSLRFDGCEFDAAPVVEGAQLFELALTGSPRLPGLLGNGLRLRRDLDLSRSHIAGAHWTSASTSKRAAVWLCESEIGGRLLCLDTVIDGQGDRALQADRIRVGGAVRLLQDFHSRGEIRLIGARISGTLDLSGALSQPERRSLVGATALTVDGDVAMEGLRTDGGRVNFRGATLGSLAADGARLHNPGGYSVSLNQARVKGSVRLVDGFTSTGLVVLNRSVVEGRLELSHGSFTCPGPGYHNVHGHAIEAISADVRGGMYLGWETVSPSVDFTEASTTFLADDPAAWPPSFTIAGLTTTRAGT